MSIGGMFRRAANAATDALFPATCVNCGAGGALICARCVSEASRLDPDATCRMCALPGSGSSLCGRCSADPAPVSSLLAVFAFDGAVRSAVHALKYDGLRAIAPALGAEMAARYGKRRKTPDAVVPIPMHGARLRARGFNHAELLARHAGRGLGAPVRTDLLRRVVDSQPQASARSESERAARVRGVFESDAAVSGLHVLLIDDVATTRSTIDSAAQTLLGSGAWGVTALVLAREL